MDASCFEQRDGNHAARGSLQGFRAWRLRSAVRARTTMCPLRKKMQDAGWSRRHQRRGGFTNASLFAQAGSAGQLPVRNVRVTGGDRGIYAFLRDTGSRPWWGLPRAISRFGTRTHGAQPDHGGRDAQDIVQWRTARGCFPAALGGHYGGETIGAATVPVFHGEHQEAASDHGGFRLDRASVHASYAMFLGRRDPRGRHPGPVRLRIGLFGAEP
jgi:hypothetical protein